MTAGVYLDTYLSALAPWLTRDDVTDLLINKPGEVWIETTSGSSDPVIGHDFLDLPPDSASGPA